MSGCVGDLGIQVPRFGVGRFPRGGLNPPPPFPAPQVLGQAVAEQHVPDLVLAAQHADPEQLGKLVRLVLGCAVSCERREGGCRAGGPPPP